MESPARAQEARNADYVVLDRVKAALFIKANTPSAELLEYSRPRFEQVIDPLLKHPDPANPHAVVSAHDQPHQWRSTVNTGALLEFAGATHEERVRGTSASHVHDVGYNVVDKETDSDGTDAAQKKYMTGPKYWFRNHAWHGAKEVRETALRMLRLTGNERMKQTPARKELLEKLQALLTYQDETGQPRQFTPEDIQEMSDDILFHNGYGDHLMDRSRMTREAHAVRLGDKVDLHHSRVHTESLIPDLFDRKSPRFSEKECAHRRAQYCIQEYHLMGDRENGAVKVVYEIDLSRYTDEMERRGAGHLTYSENEFLYDMAHGFDYSFADLGPSVRALTGKADTEQPFVVEYQFKAGRSVEIAYPRAEKSEADASTETVAA